MIGGSCLRPEGKQRKGKDSTSCEYCWPAGQLHSACGSVLLACKATALHLLVYCWPVGQLHSLLFCMLLHSEIAGL